MSKLMYTPLKKSYIEDMNDLVEQELLKGRGKDLKPRKKRGVSSENTGGDSDFKHHRTMAAFHGAESQKHADLYEDMITSNDKDIKTAAEDHKRRSREHERTADAHVKEAKKLHDPKKHGDWNRSIPSQDEVNTYLNKGGVGSGKRGHQTFRDVRMEQRKKKVMESGGLDKVRGMLKHYKQKKQQAIAAGDKEAAADYRRHESELTSRLMQIMNRK